MVRGLLRLMVPMDDAEVYTKYADELTRFASALVGPLLAEDVLASAVLSALSTPGWAEVENKRAYLYRCVASQASRQSRSAEQRLRREMRSVSADSVASSGLDVDVLSAMLSLTARQRAVVYLTYWVDLAPGEVADAVEASQRTVERDLTKARRILERKLR